MVDINFSGAFWLPKLYDIRGEESPARGREKIMAAKQVFDGDLGQLLGDLEWQYDVDGIVDMMTEYDPVSEKTFWKDEDDQPSWEEIETQQWATNWTNVEHILDWYNSRSDTAISSVDEGRVLDALTENDDAGTLVWKNMDDMDVEGIIEENALLTPENVGDIYDADDIEDDPEDDLREVACWAGRILDADKSTIKSVFDALTDVSESGFRSWKYLTRAQVAEVLDELGTSL